MSKFGTIIYDTAMVTARERGSRPGSRSKGRSDESGLLSYFVRIVLSFGYPVRHLEIP
jgi:hypothetical protein